MAPKGREIAENPAISRLSSVGAIYGGGLWVSRQPRLVPAAVARYMSHPTNGPFDARDSRRHSPRTAALCVAANRRGRAVVADRLQRGEHAQPVRRERWRISLSHHRARAAPDPQ